MTCVGDTLRAAMHRERRRYLRSALNELNLLLGDSPGLLGPQVFIVLVMQCMCVFCCNQPFPTKKFTLEFKEPGLKNLFYRSMSLYGRVPLLCLHSKKGFKSFCFLLQQFALVLTTLGLACDEVSWLFRHASVTPPKAKHKPSPEDFSDR